MATTRRRFTAEFKREAVRLAQYCGPLARAQWLPAPRPPDAAARG